MDKMQNIDYDADEILREPYDEDILEDTYDEDNVKEITFDGCHYKDDFIDYDSED